MWELICEEKVSKMSQKKIKRAQLVGKFLNWPYDFIIFQYRIIHKITIENILNIYYCTNFGVFVF